MYVLTTVYNGTMKYSTIQLIVLLQTNLHTKRGEWQSFWIWGLTYGKPIRGSGGSVKTEPLLGARGALSWSWKGLGH